MSNQEIFLSDERVLPIQDILCVQFPRLLDHNADFVTIRHEPPFTGQLPDGRVGHADHAVIQFMVVSDNPRWYGRKYGLRHGTTATLWERAWEDSEKERLHGHYVNGESMDPLERIFRGLVFRHLEEMKSLKEIMN